jgi:hypothetical protein
VRACAYPSKDGGGHDGAAKRLERMRVTVPKNYRCGASSRDQQSGTCHPGAHSSVGMLTQLPLPLLACKWEYRDQRPSKGSKNAHSIRALQHHLR